MAEHELCSNCGLELPTNAPQDLCPACLLLKGLGTDDPATLIHP